MRRYGSNKKNPNPSWPNEQSVLVIPPGSNPASVGIKDSTEIPSRKFLSVQLKDNVDSDGEREARKEPLMGNMFPDRMGNLNVNISEHRTSYEMSVNNFLSNQIGKYLKLEFLFGDNIHMEKFGRLKNVGKDFVAIQESGTENVIVCSLAKIKFINIYEY